MQTCPKELSLVKWHRDGLLGKQEHSEWTQNSVCTKISNLWQQDIYGNMSCRDTLAWKSAIYKTGLGLGPRIRQSPAFSFLTSFKLPCLQVRSSRKSGGEVTVRLLVINEVNPFAMKNVHG